MKEKPIIYRFALTTSGNLLDVMSRYFPNGQTVLNREEWRGKPPRSCGITNVSVQPYRADENQIVVDIEVTYRPEDFVSYVNQTKYVGWTLMVLDRQKDGTLLDGKGEPLKDGEPQVFLEYEVYQDADFSKFEFGELVSETEFSVEEILKFDEIISQLRESPRFSSSVQSNFIGVRRHRPTIKVILSNSPAGISTDGFGTRLININKFTPHLEQVISDQMTEVMCGFLDGRYSIKNLSNDEFVYLDLSDAFVDCSDEETNESRFDCLDEFVSESFIDDLARSLMATYKVKVSFVEDKKLGLVIRHDVEK